MAVTTQILGSRLFVKSYDHDPGATTAILASPDGGTTPWSWDVSLYNRLAFVVKPSVVGGNGITLVRLMGSTDSAGATNATVLKTTGAVQYDHLSTNGGDQCFLEVTAEEIAQIADAAGVSLRYVTVEITTSTSTDEAVVTVVAEPRFPRDALSASQQA